MGYRPSIRPSPEHRTRSGTELKTTRATRERSCVEHMDSALLPSITLSTQRALAPCSLRGRGGFQLAASPRFFGLRCRPFTPTRISAGLYHAPAPFSQNDLRGFRNLFRNKCDCTVCTFVTKPCRRCGIGRKIRVRRGCGVRPRRTSQSRERRYNI